MPIGGVLASSALNPLDLPWDYSLFTWHAWLGLALTGSPLLFLCATWLYALFFGDKKQTGNVTSMLFNRWDDKITIETESDPDPTSIEFQRIFQNAVAEALSDQSHRLVLVIDNLDRLPPSEAMHLWRTLQTFIDKNMHDPNAWVGKLWTLVPYDRSVLKKHFREVRIANASDLPFVIDDKSDGELGHFEKIFDTSLHVPSPAPTLWQSFFTDLLAHAYPNETPEALAKVIRVMEAKGGLDYTPRVLKRIINAAGPIYIQWRCEFSLADIIHYVMEQREPSPLQNINLSIASVLGNRYLITMDAIKYNAPIQIAQQVQIIAAIQDALPQMESTNLKRLEDNIQNFGQLLSWTCQRTLPFWNVQQITACAHQLISTGIFNRLAPEYVANLRNIFIFCVEQASFSIENASLLNKTFSEGLVHVHTICDHAPTSKRIIMAVISEHKHFEDIRNTQAVPIAKAIQSISQALHGTQPSAFDDDLIERIITHGAIIKCLPSKDIEIFKKQLSSHMP
jgi:hypothetical protein